MIIDIEPNFSPKSKAPTKWCDLLQYKCKTSYSQTKKLIAHTNKSTWILKIIFHIFFYRTTKTVGIAELEPTIKPPPRTVYCQSKLAKVYNRYPKYSQIWLMFVLLLPTQQQVNGHGMFRPTSNSNVLSLSHSQNENMQLQIALLKNQNIGAESLETHQLQSKIQAKRTSSDKDLNNLSKKISKQSRDSFYNASSNKYSLINLSQPKHTPHLINQKIKVEWKSSVPIYNRQTRKSRDIRLENKSHNRKPKRVDEVRLKRLVLKGLGMKKIPDMKKVNISQVEYSNKYIEYLSRLRSHQDKGTSYFNNYIGASSIADLHFLSIITNKFNDISHKRLRHKRSFKNLNRLTQNKKHKNNEDSVYGQQDKTNILLHFPLTNLKDAKFHHDKIDEANVRLMLLYSSSLATNSRRWQGPRNRKLNKISGTVSSMNPVKSCNSGDVSYNQFKRVRSRQLNLKVYQLLSSNRRRLLASRKIEFENIEYEETRTQWIEFDVTKAVRSWMNKSHENLGIEIQCDKCKSIGARILSDSDSSTQSSSGKSATPNNERFNLMPVLNIIGHGALKAQKEDDVHHIVLTNNRSDEYVHHRSNQDTTWRKEKWNNNCYKLHQRCCRNPLDVAFKDIKGFEFILQPKVFDAGYCHGRCPPRHNPAHHHALLQSLIWQEDHTRAPRPCCAPSKLEMLEILHVDENHSDKLKISTWSDMQVVECACS
ncbi:uncharacterized protein LOC119563224 [Drosophila subpulchrella]|uniref:uncharacterized protein LOC119563224 n=1 Tax=Drosophila subpulchrella TaxID=1486046 RepID=UPI0018A169C3|nr:uncharacterized protein LOC119563224 [Drosophila subpulchrella]